MASRSARKLAVLGGLSVWLALVLGATTAVGATPIGAYTTKGAYSYVSAPKLHPPIIGTDAPVTFSKFAPGYFMIANFRDLGQNVPMVGQSGPLILDHFLQPVWFNPVPTNVLALNLTTQRYNGRPALSWWQGVISPQGATLSGQVIVVDQHYRQVATLTGQDGWTISEHENLISGHNIWVTAYKNVPISLVPYGGLLNGVLVDSAAQEYDLRTGKLVYTWDALAHIPLTESETKPSSAFVAGAPVPWDAYHINSINLVGGGKFITSFRNTWAAYLVDVGTGNVEWRLGGKESTFTFGANAHFHWQHDVELHPGNLVSVFDDACCAIVGIDKSGHAMVGPPNGPSRGLVLKLDTTHHTASLVAQYIKARDFNAAFTGGTELLANGNVVVGWGSRPFFSEFSKSGKLLLDAVLPSPDLSYRAYVQTWVGTPFFSPSGAVKTAKGRATVYASWDGATEVASWRLLAGPSATHLSSVAAATKNGFETSIALAHTYKAYKVQALDSHGRVLGTSSTFPQPRSPSPGFY
jgi:hypothetical protein